MIARLAARYGGPLFAPHLTLGPGSAETIEQLRAPPLELDVTGVDCSPQFTKTLFVRFALSPALAQLRNSLGMAADDYDPHLSLLYQTMPPNEQRSLAASVDIPFARVRFVAVQAVRFTPPVATPADVEAWETVAHRPLSHPATDMRPEPMTE